MHEGKIVKSDTHGNLIEQHMLKDDKDNTHVRVQQKVQHREYNVEEKLHCKNMNMGIHIQKDICTKEKHA